MVLPVDQHHGSNDQYRSCARQEHIRTQKLQRINIRYIRRLTFCQQLSHIAEACRNEVISEVQKHRQQDIILFHHEIRKHRTEHSRIQEPQRRPVHDPEENAHDKNDKPVMFEASEV